ncbi:hypothetical protein [Pseudoalteromonas tunicata]|uniref:hypothetical protein n=1 Tax=Pseudoalteromonas tunicata TaxID=314281 RepID=UPI00273D353F|nr:hypothetical protein [Pseudoalteromonas tunicata]MDP4982084.1 hypothetical protein [Pseudoalteromonas tunicata]
MLHLNKTFINTVGFLVLANISTVAQAAFNDGCDNDKSTNPRYIRCLENKITEQQNIAQTWRNKIEFDLEKKQNETGNVQLLKVFTRAEQEFVKYVEDSCRWRYLDLLPDTIAATITYKRCELQLNQQRVDGLKFK